MTQDQGWRTPQKLFSMMLTEAKAPSTIGRRYFSAEMCNDNDDDEEEEIVDENGTREGALQNSICKCTGVHTDVAKTAQTKKANGERRNTNKNKATFGVDSFSTASHESTTRPQYNYTRQPQRRPRPHTTIIGNIQNQDDAICQKWDGSHNDMHNSLQPHHIRTTHYNRTMTCGTACRQHSQHGSSRLSHETHTIVIAVFGNGHHPLQSLGYSSSRQPNCSPSSGLSAELTSTSTHPQSDGGERREVMSPSQGPPLAKIHHVGDQRTQAFEPLVENEQELAQHAGDQQTQALELLVKNERELAQVLARASGGL